MIVLIKVATRMLTTTVFFSKKNIFTCKKSTNLMREKYSLLQLDHKKLNYTQIHTEKNGPNNRLFKKEKSDNLLHKF